MSLLNAAMNGGSSGGDVSAKTASAATAYSMIMQAINTASVDGGYKIAEVQGVFPELAPLLDPALNAISSAKISEAFDNATDALALASSSVFRDLVNGNTYLDGLGRESAELFQYYDGYDWANVGLVPSDAYSGPKQGLWISPDGTEMVWIDIADNIKSGPLSVPYDPSSVTPRVGSISTQTYSENTPESVFVSPDGTKVFVVGNSLDDVMQWTLATPFDLSTATYDGSAGVSNVPRSLNFSSDGTIVVFAYNGGVTKYSLSIPWDYVGSTRTFLDNDTSGPLVAGEFTYIDDGWGILLRNAVNSTVDVYRPSEAYRLDGLGAVVNTFDYSSLGTVQLVTCADRYSTTSKHFYLVGAKAEHLEIAPSELRAPV